ncbi:MAG: PSD1 and planctomycete cytochrome C domain-containing protein [Planctomycetota bacterium]
MRSIRLVLIASTFFLSHSAASDHEAEASDLVDFARDVRPILSDNCFHCHGPDAENQDSPFRADTEEHLLEDLGGYAGVVPGDPEESELYLRIISDDEFEVMPPPESHRVLTDKDKDVLRRWIEQGAHYAGHWAFSRVERPNLPVRQASSTWGSNPIDAFIARRLSKSGLEPSPRAKPATLLRRASLTLTGTLPAVELQERFLANPTNVAFGNAVDELLASQHYAERQSLRWLDAARYADTDGYQNDNERTNWPWRDWVTKAFFENMPFDQFTIEQIAGDMLDGSTDMQRLASAFNRNHRQNAEGGALAEEFLVENVIDRVETTSTVWLGLTMGCARCHDHKYDPLSQREFFQMYGYFNNIGEKGTGKGREANPTLKSFSPFAEVPEDLLADLLAKEALLNQAKQGLSERQSTWMLRIEEQLRQSGPSSSSADHQRQQELISKRSETQPESELESVDKDVLKILRKSSGERSKKDKQRLSQYFESVDPAVSKTKAEFTSVEKTLTRLAGPRVSVMVMKERPGSPAPAYLLNRGQYNAADTSAALPRDVPAALVNRVDGEGPADRLELARWLVSRDNPLTARVIVNRVWQDHFGVGLVKTSEDFGVQGEMPSHPDLLDWLAVEFMESGWDIKALHRLIVTSQTYCQQSHSTGTLQEADPENRLLARGPRYRADGFVIRDIVLQAGGLLNEKLGGPPVKPYQPDGLWSSLAAKVGTKYRIAQGEDLYRKSLYTYWKRAVNPPRQTIFDGGGRETCDVRVRRTNTPLQALVLLNDPTMIESARHLAKRVMQDGTLESERPAKMYRYALARHADDETLRVLHRNRDFFQKHFDEHPEEATALLSIGESERDQSLDPIQHAALTSVAHLILNLDEFISIE